MKTVKKSMVHLERIHNVYILIINYISFKETEAYFRTIAL